MKNTGKVVVWSLVGLVILGGAYYVFKKMSWNKDRALAYLSEKTNATKEGLSKLDASFLIAWAKAKSSSKNQFNYQNKSYSSETGRAI